MAKTRINISTDKDLADFIKVYAAENRTTVADIFNEYILFLKRNSDGKPVKEKLSNPIFIKAWMKPTPSLKTVPQFGIPMMMFLVIDGIKI